MLVVADKFTGRICGKSCFTCSGKTEEYSGIAVVTYVCGAVHGKYALLGKNIVHNREYALLDFAGILASCDKNEMSLVVDGDKRLAVCAVYFGYAFESGSRDDLEIGCKVIELLFRRTYKKLMNEHVLRCKFVYYTELLCIFGVCTCKTVEYEYLFVLEICEHFRFDSVEFFFFDRSVDLAPCNVVMYSGSINDKFVVRRTTCVFACFNNESAGVGKCSLAAFKCCHCEFRNGKVAVNNAVSGNSQIDGSQVFHLRSSKLNIKFDYVNSISQTVLKSK